MRWSSDNIREANSGLDWAGYAVVVTLKKPP